MKFGRFAELNESSESHGTSDKVSSEPTSSERVISEDDVITVSDHAEEEDTPAPNAQIGEEHNLTSVHVQSDYNEGLSKSRTETDLYEDFMTGENLNLLLDNINDVAHPTTEIREAEDVLEVMPPTTNQVAETKIPMVTVSGIPLLDVDSPTSDT